MKRNIDDLVRKAVRRRRIRHLTVLLEVALGDLVALEGLDATRRRLREFERQLTEY